MSAICPRNQWPITMARAQHDTPPQPRPTAHSANPSRVPAPAPQTPPGSPLWALAPHVTCTPPPPRSKSCSLSHQSVSFAQHLCVFISYAHTSRALFIILFFPSCQVATLAAKTWERGVGLLEGRVGTRSSTLCSEPPAALSPRLGRGHPLLRSVFCTPASYLTLSLSSVCPVPPYSFESSHSSEGASDEVRSHPIPLDVSKPGPYSHLPRH
jgi:hypothetical protein